MTARASWKPWEVKAIHQAKAIAVTVVTAAGGTVYAAIDDGHITGAEWWKIAIAVAAAYGVTFSVSNRTPPASTLAAVPSRTAKILPVPDAGDTV